MTESLTNFLNDQQADPVTVQHAVRYLAASLSDYLPEEEMVERVTEVTGDPETVQSVMAGLQASGTALLAGDLMVLEALWADAATRDLVREAVSGAKNRLPTVTVFVVAAAVIYCAYLLATRGRKSVEKTTEYHRDGTWKTVEKVEYYRTSGPLQDLGQLFSQLDPQQQTPTVAPGQVDPQAPAASADPQSSIPQP
ncbi:hypothetical protein [Actinomadura chokoriensis]|uniref:Uncharacterized protein n=1 Tax=Actinomadura chokoriensis TaxID=454156 RepID=A0ABV4QSE4_9ACTN